MASPLVLLTGATGFVGYLTLIHLLQSGYRVRVAVRSEAGISKIASSPRIQTIAPSPDVLFFTVVPDMAKLGAFDEAVQGATYAIHIASPVPSFGAPSDLTVNQYEQYFVRDAAASHVNMLKSAAAANGSSVKRVVLTSSCMGIMPFDYFAGLPSADYSKVHNNDSRAPDPVGPYGNDVQAYACGKIAALNASEWWFAENKDSVGFDVLFIAPGLIFGRDELTTSAESMKAGSTNAILLNLLLGTKGEWPLNGNGATGEDIAKVHVLALDPKVKGGQLLVASVPFQYEDAIDVVRKNFPKEVQDGKLSLDGKQPTNGIKMDATKTEEILGFKFASYETQVKQVADHYLSLLAATA